MTQMRRLSDLFRNVMQLAYVTENLDSTCEYFESTLGTVTCLKTYRSSLGGKVYVNDVLADEWVIDVALVNAGPTNIEIIQPVSGAVDLYRDAIRPGAPATFHHLGFRVDSFDEASEVVLSSGKRWMQYGAIEGSVRFGYVDMRAELGHFVEVMELQPGLVKHFARLEALSNVERD